MPLLPASGQHYLKLEGEASYPKSITLKGKLVSTCTVEAGVQDPSGKRPQCCHVLL